MSQIIRCDFETFVCEIATGKAWMVFLVLQTILVMGVSIAVIVVVPRVRRMLREAGYEGELRAVGDVLVDQLAYMRRCGFDAFEPDQQFDMDDVKAAFERWPEVYQNAADDRTPIWTKRHP